MAELPTPSGFREPAARERLDSWKEIAAYLKRDESTVRRWQTEGLPVHRLPHKKKATVYAYKSELDVWWNVGRSRLEAVATIEAAPSHTRVKWAPAGMVLLVAVGLASTVGVRERVTGRPGAGEFASIAVLPLKNLSGDLRQDYFADGMTEALITELGKISALRVLSHQTVNGYRQSAKSVPDIARELRVDAVLEGTVLHSGSRIRITANLVQATPERHLWAESYEFDAADVLAIETRVARDVASRIRIKVTPQEQARLSASRPVGPEAHEAWLLGRAYLLKSPSRVNWLRAKEYFETAILKDPAYAPAYAGLAELFMRARGAPTRTPGLLRRQARQWAAKALALDDAIPEAHNALARAAQQEYDWAGAEREYRRAIEVNPSYSVARIWYAMYLYAMQRFDEAVNQAHVAQELDPASPFTNTWAGSAYLLAGRDEEAWAAWQKALELDPNSSDATLVVARTHVAQAKYTQAAAELEHALSVKKDREPLLLGTLAHAYARAGDRGAALKLIDELGRIERDAADEYVPSFGVIWAYAGLADNDHAFARLQKAYEEGSDRMIWLNVDPLLDPLRSDPRFDDLVRRMDLPARAAGAK